MEDIEEGDIGGRYIGRGYILGRDIGGGYKGRRYRREI